MDKSAVADRKTEANGPEKGETQPAYADLSLYQRLELVKRAVRRLDKDGTHQIYKDGKKVGEFDYISHDAVVSAIRPHFLDAGIVIWPTVLECTKDGNRTEMWIEVDFICIDKPDNHRVTKAVGYGVDYSDKGPGRAYSYAIKSAYMKILMLNSGDDTESREHDPEAKRKSQEEAETEVTVEQVKTWAKSFNLAIQGADDPKEIDALQRENATMLLQVPDVTRQHFIKKIQDRKQFLADAERGEVE